MTAGSDLLSQHTPYAIRRSCLAGMVLLTLVGCASVAPLRDRADAAIIIPAAWATPHTVAPVVSPALALWWLHFDDPLLARLVEQALLANTSVNSAQAALRQSRALRDVSAAGLLPVLGSSATAQHSRTDGNSNGDIFKAGLDASWELDIFGVNRNTLTASEATARASAASLGDVQVSIAAEVAINYISLRGAQARLAIAEANLASQLETLQITQWRLQAGLVTSLEAEQARAAAEQTSALIPAFQTSIEQTRHALAVLTGQPPAALANVLAAAGPIPQVADDLALSIPAETLRQRPDVRAAEYRVTAAESLVAKADAERMPSFKLGGSLGLNALTLGGLTHGATVVSALLASVALPVFDGGALRAQVRAQQAALEQAQFEYQATVLTALKDVENALVALRGYRERLLHLQQAAEAAGNAALMARQRFNGGLIDFQIVLETQRTQRNTQDAVADASTELGAEYVRLYKALGGGWQPDQDLTPDANDDITQVSH